MVVRLEMLTLVVVDEVFLVEESSTVFVFCQEGATLVRDVDTRINERVSTILWEGTGEILRVILDNDWMSVLVQESREVLVLVLDREADPDTLVVTVTRVMFLVGELVLDSELVARVNIVSDGADVALMDNINVSVISCVTDIRLGEMDDELDGLLELVSES